MLKNFNTRIYVAKDKRGGMEIMMQATVNDSGKPKTAEHIQFAIKNMFTSEFVAVSVGQNSYSVIHIRFGIVK